MVFIVDNTGELQRWLLPVLFAEGYQTRAFDSVERFLREENCSTPGCLILDTSTAKIGDSDLPPSIKESMRKRPTVFLTAGGDVQTSVLAMKLGAVDFLQTPIDPGHLLTAIDQALRIDADAREELALCNLIKARIALLTRREREVLEGVTRGQLNKQIAWDMGISEKTVKLFRGNVMEKMRVHSVAQLVTLGAKIGFNSYAIDTWPGLSSSAMGSFVAPSHAPTERARPAGAPSVRLSHVLLGPGGPKANRLPIWTGQHSGQRTWDQRGAGLMKQSYSMEKRRSQTRSRELTNA
jgi:FixJ family two-component response regulator